MQQIEFPADAKARKAAKKRGISQPKKTQPVGSRPLLSASDLEGVVGQAIKNLSRLRILSSDPEFIQRRANWEKDNCSLPSPGAISRIRRNGSPAIANIDAKFADAAAHPFSVYEVGIVVPNYSLAVLEREFNKIGNQKVDQPVLQAFWLLSGFMHACLEVGARPIVFVHP